MRSKKSNNINNQDSEKIDEIVSLLRFSIAIELFKLGSTQQQIARRLGIAKKTINKMLLGIKRNNGHGKE